MTENRVALYVRVSKKDHSQTVENQLLALRELCDRRGWEVVLEFSDNESGRYGRGERKGFDAMLRAASTREFDILVFWSLDRFSRQGIPQTVHYLRILEGHGVRFFSYQDEYIDTVNGVFREHLIGVIAHFAQYEVQRMSERTKAGIERARRAGKRIGRPHRVNPDAPKMLELRNQGMTNVAIAKRFRISESSVRRCLRIMQARLAGRA